LTTNPSKCTLKYNMCDINQNLFVNS
jgi:hypothetical protein